MNEMELIGIKHKASNILDSADFLDDKLSECESFSDIENEGIDIGGAIEEIERDLNFIKRKLGI